jgi:hypothetical protein
MKDEIGRMAGAIWHGLNTHGELSIAQLKKLVEGKAPRKRCETEFFRSLRGVSPSA